MSYVEVKGVIGGQEAGDYCRLFMVPGCLHCGGGPGAADVDWVSVIVDWVEHRKAPDRLIASKKQNGKLMMTRPLYPYPACAIYKGSGDTNSAESFGTKALNHPSRAGQISLSQPHPSRPTLQCLANRPPKAVSS